MKMQAHWQTDVLAGFALGTATGLWAHERNMHATVSVLPHGFAAHLDAAALASKPSRWRQAWLGNHGDTAS